ncbi:MAG: FAD-binding protein, partial [Candidatus Omnitrophica bacterium]|nr:FAD-binding protein [Candidatus Omnitrophota bacterium]
MNKSILKKRTSQDAIIVGAGPAGLMAAIDLAKSDLKVLVVESNACAGGRLWLSDFLISSPVFMPQFREILDELEIPYKKGKNGLSVNAGPGFSSRLILAACDVGVKILNLAEFQDLIYLEDKIKGIVVNWKPRLSLKEGVAAEVSLSLNSQIVADTTGTNAAVYQSLRKKGVVKLEEYGQIDPAISEEL